MGVLERSLRDVSSEMSRDVYSEMSDSMSSHMKRLVSVVAVLALGTGCADMKKTTPDASLREAASRFVPPDARNLFEAPDLPWIQLSFEVTRAPTEFGIGLDQLEGAQRDGWLLCERNTPDWAGFDDMRQEPMRYVTERAYMLHTDGILMVVIGRHEHETEGAWKTESERGTAIVQNVFITAHRANEQEARAQAADLGLQCS